MSPFQDSEEGQTHFFGDGCPEHPNKCTNCGKAIEDIAILMPTTDEKRKIQCPQCAKEYNSEI